MSPPMHPSLQRVFDLAQEAAKTSRLANPVNTLADLARFLNISAQTLNHWKRRGVSKEGALQAGQLLGCPAQWVLDGKGWSPGQALASLTAAEPALPSYAPRVSEVVQGLGVLFEQVPLHVRKAAMALLERLVSDPADAPSVAAQANALLSSTKRDAA